MMNRPRKLKAVVSASALSQMGVCERLVVFEHRAGKRLTTGQKAALRRGLRAHQRFAAEGLPETPRNRHCSVATQGFGEGRMAQVLRCCRDRALRCAPAGRSLIPSHYRWATPACHWMPCWPILKGIVRAMLVPLARLLGHLVSARGDGRVD